MASITTIATCVLGLLALSTANPVGCPSSGVSVSGDALSVTAFEHNATLSNDYFLQWNANTTHIVFQAQVSTTGYVGLGISERNRMYPSDLVIGWVDANGAHMKDRYSTQYGVPVVDSNQDWMLVDANEESGVTTLTVLRALNTCDANQDVVIGTGSNYVIWSFNDADPKSDTRVSYHGGNRGVASLTLVA